MIPARLTTGWALVLGGLLFGAGCYRNEEPVGMTVRDSAGVTLWESTEPLWQDGTQWKIDAEPLFSIGELDGEGPFSFGSVTDVAMLDGDRVVVADGFASEVRVFTIDGAHRTTIGSRGDGPGEFRNVRSVEAVGSDSLLIFDQGLNRLSYFRVSGELLETVDLGGFELDGRPAPAAEVARLSDGRLVVREGFDFAGGLGAKRDTAQFFITDAVGEFERIIDRVPGVRTVGEGSNGRNRFRYQAFTTIPRWAVHRNTVYIAPGEWFGIRKVTAGGVVGVLRRAGTPRQVVEADQARLVADMVRSVPAERREAVRSFVESMPLPERFPAYTWLLVDPDGFVWAERSSETSFRPGPEWDVFSSKGQYLGVVENPTGLRIFEIGRDYVLGAWRDELDVPYVRSYALLRR